MKSFLIISTLLLSSICLGQKDTSLLKKCIEHHEFVKPKFDSIVRSFNYALEYERVLKDIDTVYFFDQYSQNSFGESTVTFIEVNNKWIDSIEIDTNIFFMPFATGSGFTGTLLYKWANQTEFSWVKYENGMKVEDVQANFVKVDGIKFPKFYFKFIDEIAYMVYNIDKPMYKTTFLDFEKGVEKQYVYVNEKHPKSNLNRMIIFSVDKKKAVMVNTHNGKIKEYLFFKGGYYGDAKVYKDFEYAFKELNKSSIKFD